MGNESLKVFHIDDDLLEIEAMRRSLSLDPHGVPVSLESFREPEKFVARLYRGSRPDIVVIDIDLGGELSGVDLVAKTRTAAPAATIVMQSNLDKVATIKDCLKLGADDFISKKTEPDSFKERLILAHRASAAKRRNVTAQGVVFDVPGVVGETMTSVAGRVKNIVDSAVSAIHLFGESGTGKEVVADLFASALPEQVPFVRVHCGAISPNLLESELFGHVKGAFTGAKDDRVGLIEQANGGYVFLDEVATLSPHAQVSLLRVLESGEIRPVGSSKSRQVDIKIISATNEDIKSLCEQGGFRHDLYQRLRELVIELPPLRSRKAEIPHMIIHFCETMDGGPYSITKPTMDTLCEASWSGGNVRELRNCLRAMTEFARDKVLTPLCIPDWLWEDIDRSDPIRSGKESHSNAAVSIDWDGAKQISFEALSNELLLMLIEKLARQSGKQSMRSVAAAIGLPRSTLADRLKALVRSESVDIASLSKMVNLGKSATE